MTSQALVPRRCEAGKAFTSASMGHHKVYLTDFGGGNPEKDGLRSMASRMVIQADGLAIRIGGVLFGGIGLGGAPSGGFDET